MNTELSRELSYAKEKVQYDTYCKRILSHKIILAWILRRTVKEFTAMSVNRIISCIEGTPEISSLPVDPGGAFTKAPCSEKISGMSNEDSIPLEGRIYYDIRFKVSIPDIGENLQMIINVEAQKNFRPGYEIVTRGIFYASRMISSQLGTEFSYSDYDRIKKVYSIWICMNAPQKIGNAISEYSIQKKDLIAGLPDQITSYDKLSVIIIALNEDLDSSDSFINMINTLLSPEKKFAEKKKTLEELCQIKMDAKMRKELNSMCNLSDYVEEKGIKKGRESKALEIVLNLLKMGTLSDRDIMKAAELTPEEFEKIKKSLS